MSSQRPPKLKVLIVVYKSEIGGAERVAVSLAKGLNRQKYAPLFCCFKGGILEKEVQGYKIPVFNLNKSGRFDFLVLFKLLNIIKKEKIDIIHTHSFSPNLWGRVAGIIARVPLIIGTEHTVATAKTNLQKHIDKILAKFTSKIISVSESVKNSLLEEENISPDKILTIYNGIDFTVSTHGKDIMDKKRKELGIDLHKKVIVAIGRLEPPKGYEYLLESAKIVTREFPSVLFLIVGNGYLRSDLEKLANDLNIDKNVIFTGHRTDIDDILSMSDIAVLSSVREGFSISLLEYMACKKPIIATDVGGNREAIISGESGIIVPPNNPVALAKGIMKLLTDNKMAEDMGMKARERYNEYFTTQRMIIQIEKIYETLYNLSMSSKDN